ncbi:MAG: TrkH family potassium uptake protein [Bacteroidaceae bacterium]|nr:TrkH family potassium uptake protein [Bacteroidaceae bacterium]
MHWKIIFRIIGALLMLLATVMLGCSAVALFFDGHDFFAFLASALITLLVSLWLLFFGKGATNKYSRRDGYLTLTLSWISFALVGTLPLLLSGTIHNFSDAFFESMSYFTTTGCSVIDNTEALPHALLFWRSISQWFGGLGIVFFTVAVLPMFGFSGVQLFAAETTGYAKKKSSPRVAITARWILTVYVVLTLGCAVALWFSGMQPFEAICHGLTTISTGGLSTRNENIAAFQSARIEWVLIIFMFIAGINYTLLFLCVLRGKFRSLFRSSEFHWYLFTVGIFTLILTVGMILGNHLPAGASFTDALFMTISVQTTTGFTCGGYPTWPVWVWMILSFVMYFGAMGGSSSGAMKSSRIAIFAKSIQAELRRILHPNAVLPVRMDGEVISSTTRTTVLTFVCLYMLLIFFGWLMMIICGVNFADSYGLTLCCVGNVGIIMPGISCASLPLLAKWVTSFLMLVGRLELFSVLLILTPSFWREGNF